MSIIKDERLNDKVHSSRVITERTKDIIAAAHAPLSPLATLMFINLCTILVVKCFAETVRVIYLYVKRLIIFFMY